MSAVPASGDPREGGIFGELVKIPAFLRRDFLQAWSYRMAFVTDAIGLALQTALFFYISKIVDPNVLPTFGGARVSYLEYVVVGIAMTMLIALGIFRAAAAFRNEQLMGTLEVLLMTPTAPWTIQIGSIVYDLVYIPLRTGLFIAVVALATDVSFDTDGIVPATVILLAFLPFVWGIGIVYAASSLTFKQAGGGIAITLLTFSSGAYFPLELFPDWLADGGRGESDGGGDRRDARGAPRWRGLVGSRRCAARARARVACDALVRDRCVPPRAASGASARHARHLLKGRSNQCLHQNRRSAGTRRRSRGDSTRERAG